MMDKLGELLQYRVKAILIGMVALGIGLICYKFLSAYFDRNQHSWETNLNVNVGELVALADQKVMTAKMQLDWDCGAFTLSGKDEGPGCEAAKQQYEAALKHKADVESRRAEVLSQAGQTKAYYDGLRQSAKQKPLPLYAFVGMGMIILAALLYFLLPLVQKAVNKSRGGACSDDGLR